MSQGQGTDGFTTVTAGPLNGITVVSFEHAVAAPFATRQLADLGAYVVKIERPDRGDFARHYDGTVSGMSSFFIWLNRGKHSLALDINTSGAREILDRLLGAADVVVHNLNARTADRLAISPAALSARLPRLIAAAISGYGDSGPYAGRKAYDLLVQAESGMLSITGTSDAPAKAGASIADIAAGMYTFSAVLTALFARERTGRGAAIDISMLDALAEWMGAQAHYGHGSGTNPLRSGAHHATIAPYGPYRAADGAEIFLAVQSDTEWHRLCTGLGAAGLGADARFATNVGRVRNRAEMDELLVPAIAARTGQMLTELLDEHRIAWSLMREAKDLHEHPQLRATGRWVPTGSPAGPVDTLLPVASFGPGTPAFGPIPALGQHTDEILGTLGFTPEQVVRFHDEEIVT